MIYVDWLMKHGWKMYGRYVESCHMFTDDLKDIEPLHQLAAKIGLKKSYFQNKKGFPHYDLVSSKRQFAIDNGAMALNAEDKFKWLDIIRAMRKEAFAVQA